MAFNVAARAGLQLENPDMLVDAPMQTRLDGVQAEAVLALLAEGQGLRLDRTGNRVRFFAR